MKKVTRRAASALLVAALILVGMAAYLVRYAQDGRDWALFAANQNIYSGGQLALGTVTDRNGVILAAAEEGKYLYSDDQAIRMATLHAVGDPAGNIGTGALRAFSDRLAGYTPFGGVSSEGGTVALSIDAELCKTAYAALAGRRGAVMLMDYSSGEILCMVSTPSYDVELGFDEGSSAYDGVYLNRCISARYTPGSVFKLVTLAAAIENIDDLYERSFWCAGSVIVDGVQVTCSGTHGSQTIEQALANSCNCAFAEISLELGAETLAAYAEKLGMTVSHDLSGIDTLAGSFEKAESGSAALAWSGIGQSTDLVCPYAMLRLSAAVAGGGTVREGSLLAGESGKSTKVLSPATAEKIRDMMSYNVAYSYGSWNFPGLSLCAKSGTAEVGDGSSHAWFTGFLDDEEHPYAFVVLIENGGGGLSAAGTVANTVLQAAVSQK
ncbi:MAG: penicillin-binding transpeptidase domain-containing protein [Oscillospiraceae bacterium]